MVTESATRSLQLGSLLPECKTWYEVRMSELFEAMNVMGISLRRVMRRCHFDRKVSANASHSRG